MIAFLFSALLAAQAPASASTPQPGGIQRDVVLTDFPPFARADELLRRTVSPLNVLRIRRQLAQSGQHLKEESVEPKQERFVLYVPPGPAPPSGYALLVFVPPWEDARVPQQWIPVLDNQHTIYVSAANSGNQASVFDRREPLALIAEYNIARRYPLDPARIYVGGFSGGSRVALHLALSYPDVFRGALLDAGSDPVGGAQLPLPPADLFHLFQQSTRLVYLSGTNDHGPADRGDADFDNGARPSAPPPGLFEAERQGAGVTMYMSGTDASLHRDRTRADRDSLQPWCIVNVDSITMSGVGHELADAGAFGRALDALSKPARGETSGLAACRQRNQQAMDAELQQAQKLVEQHKPDDARKLLEQIDARYGGLAAPQSVELMQRIQAAH
jgi:pimeloyl-ACP methyl ester carboxylesterase